MGLRSTFLKFFDRGLLGIFLSTNFDENIFLHRICLKPSEDRRKCGLDRLKNKQKYRQNSVTNLGEKGMKHAVGFFPMEQAGNFFRTLPIED